MNGLKYLADTNAVIYRLGGNACMKPFLQERLAVSVITCMELLSFPGLSEEEDNTIRRFLSLCEIIQIDERIQEETIRLRRKHKIKLPDSIIAASSITQKLTLITADAGFTRIEDLQMVELQPET